MFKKENCHTCYRSKCMMLFLSCYDKSLNELFSLKLYIARNN